MDFQPNRRDFMKLFFGGLVATALVTPKLVEAAVLMPVNDKYARLVLMVNDIHQMVLTLPMRNKYSNWPKNRYDLTTDEMIHLQTYDRIDAAFNECLSYLLENFPNYEGPRIKNVFRQFAIDWSTNDSAEKGLREIDEGIVPIMIMKNLLGRMIIPVRVGRILSWHEFVKRYAHVLPHLPPDDSEEKYQQAVIEARAHDPYYATRRKHFITA